MTKIAIQFSTWMMVFAVFGSQGLTAEPIRLRVLSYNIHHAEGVDGKLDVERIAKVINAVDPDIVALQEVDQKVQRSNGVHQPKELARLTKMNVAFGANIPLQGGHYGNAILSRFPITKRKNELLPNVNDGEQRGVLVGEITIPDLPTSLLILATHFDHRANDQERTLSAKFINQRFTADNGPALLMGDLNDVIGSATLDQLVVAWTRTNSKALPTIPVKRPTRQIDFVLFRPVDRWTVVETRVLDEAVASDHRPILSVLEIRPK
ncbi:endonuclease/exonuclease/phosphatase family protein [Thalassoroseus pseudoceratinae]|uniref:endonuclease/exonuclease/phosphatase family protein n=1 Tax=Thalassoroseus pseudoceratinae TaxID=2713176 RepID=UPI00141E8893|nr:endonuclease/exonuclease/phosphatase family protein [Thalassoroseus pseudoceratinae]